MLNRKMAFLTPLFLLVFGSCSKDESPVQPEPDPPVLTIGDKIVAEGNVAIFVVSLDKPAEKRVTFSYFTSDITAQANLDYFSVSGADTIPVDASMISIVVATIDDSSDEPDETFSLTLTSVANAEIGDSVGQGTIIDNDPTGISFAGQVKPILMGSCANCHAFGQSYGGFSMGDLSYSAVINAKGPNTFVLYGDSLVVKPGNSAQSTLYTKTTSSPPFGGWMPFGNPNPLDTALSNRIKSWIDQGALDN